MSVKKKRKKAEDIKIIVGIKKKIANIWVTKKTYSHHQHLIGLQLYHYILIIFLIQYCWGVDNGYQYGK